MTDELTWEDVVAVCKLMGVKYERDEWDGEVVIYRLGGIFGSIFSDPAVALEFISAEEHPLEKKYANILRTKP